MNQEELIKKYGIAVGYLKALRDKATGDGFPNRAAYIQKLLEELGEA